MTDLFSPQPAVTPPAAPRSRVSAYMPAHLLTQQELDAVLTAQLIVAWAGEQERLNWWGTLLVDPYGGEDLFKRLTPDSWEWTVLEAVREIARDADRRMRQGSADARQMRTLFWWGAEQDDRITLRLRELKEHHPTTPHTALPQLAITREPWQLATFEAWLQQHGAQSPPFTTTPAGRRLRTTEHGLARHDALLGALLPIAAHYPLPYIKESLG